MRQTSNGTYSTVLITRKQYEYWSALPVSNEPKIFCAQAKALVENFCLDEYGFNPDARILRAPNRLLNWISRTGMTTLGCYVVHMSTASRLLQSASYFLFGFNSFTEAFQSLRPGNCLVGIDRMDKLSALRNAAHEVAHKILDDRGYLQEEKFPQEFANEFKEWLFHDQTRMIAILERARIKTI